MKVSPQINTSRLGTQIIADILKIAQTTNALEIVACHLVGATLSLYYSDTTDLSNPVDRQLARIGDYHINDTFFHVTVAPMPETFEKCEVNIRNGFRAILLVTSARVAAARGIAEMMGLHEKVGILSIEAFVGLKIEEMSEFKKEFFSKELRQLLETYNKRISEVETDLSLMIKIPESL